MVSLEKLDAALRTLATGAGAAKFIIGYYEDVFQDRKALANSYPLIRMLPPNQTRQRDPDSDQYQLRSNISCHYLFDRNKIKGNELTLTLERLKCFDSAITILEAFLDAIDDHANMDIGSVTEDWNLIPEGQNLENTVTVNIPNIIINAYCTIV